MTNNNNADVIVDMDETYHFCVEETVCDDYKIAKKISQWLQKNLESLTDDDHKTVFSKVNTGFNENSLKTFGNKAVCDVYINRVEYEGDFDVHAPIKVKTIVLFYLKGANNHTYEKACELHDYILQEFIENENFRRLDGVVNDTYITNSELMTQPINKKWGVMGAFELTHQLY